MFENKFELSNYKLAYNLLLLAGFIKGKDPMLLPSHIHYLIMDESLLVIIDADVKFSFNYGPNVENTIISLLISEVGIKESICFMMVYNTELIYSLFVMKDYKHTKQKEESYDLSDDCFDGIVSLIHTI